MKPIARILATFVLLISTLFHTTARADDDDNWPCEVMLCLANPDGPMAVAQCVNPIKRLYQATFKFKPDPFPSCEQAGPGNKAVPVYNDYYAACPDGTTELPGGSVAVQATPELLKAVYPQDASTLNIAYGIGDGSGAASGDNGRPAKTCVGTKIGTLLVVSGTNDARETSYVDAYDRVAFVDPYPNGNAIHVYRDGKLYRVVRPN